MHQEIVRNTNRKCSESMSYKFFERISMIKPVHFRYYILSAIAISVLSLALSIVSLRQKVGRYQFREARASIHILDTKTGRLFSRRISDIYRASRGGKTARFDLGTVNKPVSTLENNTIVQLPRGFVPDELPDSFVPYEKK